MQSLLALVHRLHRAGRGELSEFRGACPVSRHDTRTWLQFPAVWSLGVATAEWQARASQGAKRAGRMWPGGVGGEGLERAHKRPKMTQPATSPASKRVQCSGAAGAWFLARARSEGRISYARDRPPASCPAVAACTRAIAGLQMRSRPSKCFLILLASQTMARLQRSRPADSRPGRTPPAEIGRASGRCLWADCRRVATG